MKEFWPSRPSIHPLRTQLSIRRHPRRKFIDLETKQLISRISPRCYKPYTLCERFRAYFPYRHLNAR